MKTLETILPTLHNLFIEQLPLYIEKINKEKNDGIILPPFQNKTLFENCQKLPYYKLTFEEAEYTEKDRIIENTVFKLCFEIRIDKNTDEHLINFARYEEAVKTAIKEGAYDEVLEITKTNLKNCTIYIRFTL
ncbi:MAG: hypothetical protein IK024_12660 [Treponema sp.]|nr:hypothetical protein [Treponema sp.]